MRNQKTLLITLIAISLTVIGGIRIAAAQESNKETSKQAASENNERPPSAYRLDFTLNELENGKKVNSRQYSLNAVPGWNPTNQLKIGTRVPVEAKQGEMQYIDVGTNIWARMLERGDAPQLEVHADLTNFADPEAENRHSTPLLRQLQINASTVATMGKTIVVGMVDDPNSKRQYQLEVTVTKLR